MATQRTHLEEYLYLPALTHNAALIAWGGFYFKVQGELDSGTWRLLDDDEIPEPDPQRPGSIGISSKPYGQQAQVFVTKAGQPEGVPITVANQNYAIVTGLSPDTAYRYRVVIHNVGSPPREWAAGPLRDWTLPANGNATGSMRLSGRSYRNEFRTFPAPDQPSPSLTFAVMGDQGRGVRDSTSGSRCQREVAQALEKTASEVDLRLILTTGDNVYSHSQGTGNEDDDWFFTYYQPYRHLINRIPVFPVTGNHDDGETEERDDRDALYDNLFIKPHFNQLRPMADSTLTPGLCYRARFGRDIEFIAVDTSRKNRFDDRYFLVSPHREFLSNLFAEPHPPRWRVPFCHHPPYCAGPGHDSSNSTRALMLTQGKPGGVRAVFSGHEHNFQHARHDGLDFFISGGGGEYNPDEPENFDEGKTQTWGGNKEGHFLLVNITGERMEVTPFGHLATDGNTRKLPLHAATGDSASPIAIQL